MTNPTPKWIMKRYSKLWKKFQNSPFTYNQIEKILTIDDKRVISVVISELRKSGWIDVEIDKNDTRKRIYQLKTPELIIGEIAKLK